MKYFLFSVISLILLTSGYYGLVVNMIGLYDQVITISVVALVLETLLLLVIQYFLYAVTKRKRMAFILTCIFYLTFLIATSLKSKVLGAPIFPNDFVLIADLVRTWEVFVLYVPFLLVILIVTGIICYQELKKTKAEKVYSKSMIIGILMIVIFLLNFHREDTRLWLRSHGIFYKKNVNLVKKGMQNGFLLSFIQAMFFVGKPDPPKSYSKEAIAKIAKKYNLFEAQTKGNEVDNVIILMTESFANPVEYGWLYSEKVVPFYNKITESNNSGFAISPVFGGRSINAEFEIMTGMTNRFTPIETTPYQEFVDKNIPSLAWVFKNNGYQTNAIQMVKFEGFGYGKIYDYVGVDNKVSLSLKDPTMTKDPSGRSVSNKHVSEEILDIIKEQNKSFIFVFLNSTHSPWKISDYPDSNLTIENDINGKKKNKLLAFANALNHVDDMFEALIGELSVSTEKSMVLIVGDHQPGISYFGENYVHQAKYSEFINHILKRYQTSIAMWSNIDIAKQENFMISMNLIPGYILKNAGVEVDGFMKFIMILEEKYDVISHMFKLKQAGIVERLPSNQKSLINDYKLLQYDILFGEHYLSQ